MRLISSMCGRHRRVYFKKGKWIMDDKRYSLLSQYYFNKRFLHEHSFYHKGKDTQTWGFSYPDDIFYYAKMRLVRCASAGRIKFRD